MSDQTKNNTKYQDLYKFQEDNGYFKADSTSKKPPFTIMIPPPNVTGNLHIGHALVMTIQDIIIRYKRMTGFDALWLPGTDHASIATQMLVEKMLLEQGIYRREIGRTKFIEKVWEWKDTYCGIIQKQLRTIGCSPDWSREHFTMDNDMSEAVKYAFIKLYNEKLIYKDNRLVNWDPSLLTSLSDLEVNMIETNGNMWYIKYQIENSDEFITVATTRPETMLGDTGIAVNPNDPRFKHLIGKNAILPILERKIKIVGDEYADMEKGTGAVKITPAHDFNDFEVGKRHNLPMISVFTPEAKIDTTKILDTNDFVDSLADIDRFIARKLIVKKLQELDVIAKIETHIHPVPHSDRGGAIVEPRLTEQWYLDVSDMAKKSIKLVEDGEIKFIPKTCENTFFSWLKNIQPWCISRQLWWGHQIPAYYTDDGKVFVADSLKEAQKQAGEGVKLTQDEDVLDTWFSSGLWPMSTLGWPNESAVDFQRYFPTSTLITGSDIIFYWVARMIMFSVHFTGKAPFKNAVLHGLILDENGIKMSKTKGNVINPLDLIDEFDIDTLRWTLCSEFSQGCNINFGKSNMENGRKFITKLKNAITFWELKGVKEATDFEAKNSTPITNWIIDKMNIAITNAKTAMENYRYDEYAQIIYHFVWDDFCDNYIELSKADEKNNDIILSTAKLVLQNILKMLQPVIPFLTAELWEEMGCGKKEEFIKETYAEQIDIDTKTVSDIDWVINFISVIRNVRAEHKIGFKTELEISSENKGNYDKIIEKITNTHFNNEIETSENTKKIIMDNQTTLYIKLPIVDKKADLEKAMEEVKMIVEQINKLEAQLKNKAFTNKAPPNVIKDREETLSKLRSRHNQLKIFIEEEGKI